MNRLMTSVAVTVLAVLCSASVCGAEPQGDVQVDRAIRRIVIPDRETAAERHAANELVANIALMTGRSVSVIKESAAAGNANGGRGINLGRTRSNLARHNPDSWPTDTIFVGYGEGDIAILGQGTQGTLFATFEFLRDQGCRWYMPVTYHKLEVGRHIPKRATLELSGKPKKHSPSFPDRGWHMTAVMPGPHFRDWATRNGVNALTTGDTCILYPDSLGRGREKQSGHTLAWFVPSGAESSTVEKVKKRFGSHPDWYPLVGGQRTWKYRDGRRVQACLSNRKVVDHVAREVIRFSAEGYKGHERPNWRMMSIGHNDEPTFWCECEACRAMDGPGSTWKANDVYDAYPNDPKNQHGTGPLGQRYAMFANRVARQGARQRRDLLVSFYAYGSTVAPPRDSKLKLEENVVVEFAYSDHCLKHDIDDPACPNNVRLKAWIEDWSRRGKVVFYDYPPTGRHIHVPTGFFRHYQKLLRFLHRNGVIGLSGESQGVWAGSALFHYIRARLMWDIDSDVDELTREFCRDLFGDAANTMLAYYRRYENGLAHHPGHMVWGGWVAQFDPQVIRDMQDLLDKAKRETDDPAVQLRLKLAQVSLNTFVITQVENTPAPKVTAKQFDRFRSLQAETLAMIRGMNLPYPMAATGPFIDRLKNNGYRPPFEALRGKQRLVLPVVWRFRTDPDDHGVKKGWPGSVRFSAKPWQDIRIDDFWTNQGIRHHGAAWYTTKFTVPKKVKEDLWLLFDMLDGAAEIWIDGKLAGKTPAAPWDKPKAVDLTKWVRPGATHQLVMRVVKKSYAAGIKGRVRLMEALRIVGDR